MILFQLDTKYYDTDSATHKVYEFSVPKGITELRLSCSYSPKYVEDNEKALAAVVKTLSVEAPYANADEAAVRRFLPLVNMLSYSLDSPKGWVGTAHAHSPEQQHVVREKGSSFAFADTEITEGVWKLTVSVDGVVDSFIAARLLVEGL